MSRIVSSLAGRIRIRDRHLRDKTQLDKLANELLKIPAISELQCNPRTGSVVVHFDANIIDIATLETQIEAAVDKVLAAFLKSPQLSKKQVNRYSKIGMVGSLAVSLAFGLARKKRWRRWHIVGGYLFLANLGVHLIIYRKTLFR